jgi:hypothetical protein
MQALLDVHSRPFAAKNSVDTCRGSISPAFSTTPKQHPESLFLTQAKLNAGKETSVSALKSVTSRANGAKSHGPVTPEGKARSARNASTHGIFKSPFVLRNEQDALFLQLEAEFTEEWDPQGPTESALVDQMVICRWRLNRVWATEAAAIDMQMDEDAEALAEKYGEFDEACRTAAAMKHLSDDSNFLSLLQRYDTSLSRQFDRALVRLRQFKRDRAPQPLPDQLHTKKLQNEPKATTQLQAVLNIEDARRLFGALGYEFPPAGAQEIE